MAKTKPGKRSNDIVVDDLRIEEIDVLKARAKQHGQSLNDEVLSILRDAVKPRRRAKSLKR